MDALIAFDHALFELINTQWTNSLFDWYFPNITDLHRTPVGLVGIACLLAFWAWRKRFEGVKWIVALVLTIGLADSISYRLIKPIVNRDRPVAAGLEVQLRSHNHSGMAFPSNHATNIVAAATVLSFAFPAATLFFFFIAASVAYSRIYVGVHFPLDVLGGIALGYVCALFVLYVLSQWLSRRRWREATARPTQT